MPNSRLPIKKNVVGRRGNRKVRLVRIGIKKKDHRFQRILNSSKRPLRLTSGNTTPTRLTIRHGNTTRRLNRTVNGNRTRPNTTGFTVTLTVTLNRNIGSLLLVNKNGTGTHVTRHGIRVSHNLSIRRRQLKTGRLGVCITTLNRLRNITRRVGRGLPRPRLIWVRNLKRPNARGRPRPRYLLNHLLLGGVLGVLGRRNGINKFKTGVRLPHLGLERIRSIIS